MALNTKWVGEKNEHVFGKKSIYIMWELRMKKWNFKGVLQLKKSSLIVVFSTVREFKLLRMGRIECPTSHQERKWSHHLNLA